MSESDHLNQNGDLIALQRCYLALSQDSTLLDVKDYRDKAEAVRQYAKSARLGLQMQNEAAEHKLRAERMCGLLLGQLRLRGGNRRSKLHDVTLSLEKLGIQRIQSHRWQRIAVIPEDVFEEYLRECLFQEKEMTDAGLFRYAKQRAPDTSASVNGRGLQKECPVRLALRQLVAAQREFPCMCIYPEWPRLRRVNADRDSEPLDAAFVHQIAKLPIDKLAGGDAQVHLWTTSARWPDAMSLFDGWGLIYRIVLVIARPVREYGAHWRTAQDFLLLATKGHPTFKNNNLPSLIETDDVFPQVVASVIRPLIERVSPGPYLDVLGHSQADGWTVIDG